MMCRERPLCRSVMGYTLRTLDYGVPEVIALTSVFQIIGPVMVGPSSSHTAGAARLGNIARCICDEEPVRVDFYLHAR